MRALFFAILFSAQLTQAAVTVSVNGSNHTIPQTNERGWGANVTAWIQAISNYTLQPSGGTFTLTNEVYTGATYGFKVPYIKTATALPASAGVLRLANTDKVAWRNYADGGNLTLGTNTSDQLVSTADVVLNTNANPAVDAIIKTQDSTSANSQDLKITTGTTTTSGIGGDITIIPGASSGSSAGGSISINARDAAGGAANGGEIILAGGSGVGAGTDGKISLLLARTATLKIAQSGSGSTTPVAGYVLLNQDSSGNSYWGQVSNAGVATGAAIAVNKLAALTASRVAITDGSGFLSAADTATYPSLTELSYVKGATSSLQDQITAITASASDAQEIRNCSIAASVAGNALTVALKDAGGSDPSGGSPCKISFRSATAATGTYTEVSTSAAVSVVAASGDTLGTADAIAATLYVYAINNAGTVVLGIINGALLDEGSVFTSTALTGGADNTFATLYTTATQTSKAIRLLGRITITEAAAGTWATAAAEVSNAPFYKKPWYVNVNIAGANPSLGISALTAYTEIKDGGLTMTPVTGSAPAGVMCETTNAADPLTTGTSTCDASAESLGVSFAAPEPGLYEVCAAFAWGGTLDTGEALSNSFQLIETPTNAQTHTQEGKQRVAAQFTSAATDTPFDYPFRLCGLFTFSSAGTKGVRLMFEQSVGGTPDASIVRADADGAVGQRDVNFTVFRK